jgi:hypothetical protein
VDRADELLASVQEASGTRHGSLATLQKGLSGKLAKRVAILKGGRNYGAHRDSGLEADVLAEVYSNLPKEDPLQASDPWQSASCWTPVQRSVWRHSGNDQWSAYQPVKIWKPIVLQNYFKPLHESTLAKVKEDSCDTGGLLVDHPSDSAWQPLKIRKIEPGEPGGPEADSAVDEKGKQEAQTLSPGEEKFESEVLTKLPEVQRAELATLKIEQCETVDLVTSADVVAKPKELEAKAKENEFDQKAAEEKKAIEITAMMAKMQDAMNSGFASLKKPDD